MTNVTNIEKKRDLLKAKLQEAESKLLSKEEKLKKKAELGLLLDWPVPPEKEGSTPICCIENIEALLKHYSVMVRYNEMRKDIELELPIEYHSDRKLNNQISWVDSKARLHGINNIDAVTRYTETLATPYHPAREWILSKPWDQKSRLEELYNTINSPCPIKELLMKRWLLASIQALFAERPTYEGILVFVGSQGKGKTSWLRTLVPKGQDWVADGADLNVHDKDSVLNVVAYWMVELGEIGTTFTKSDLSALKAFITKRSDRIRPAYARKVDDYTRRTVFFGTVDDFHYLNDEAGNRRYWTIEVNSINLDHTVDMQQLWAEVLELWRNRDSNGETHWLQPQERKLLDEYNSQFETINPLHEKVLSHIDLPGAGEGHQNLNITEILAVCGVNNPTKKETNAVANLLKRNGFTYGNAQYKKWKVRVLKDDSKG